MKKILNISIFVAICVFISLSGCKKYEDGPGFSLSSKKSRISADWEFKKVIYSSIDVTSEYIGSSWEMKKDGDFKFITNNDIESGTWEFVLGKEALIFNYSGAYTERYNIKRLTSKELWIEMTDDGDTLFIELSAR